MWFDSECLPAFADTLLALEADRMRGGRVDPAVFAREKQVVLSELSLRDRLSPEREVMESAFRACYPAPVWRGSADS